MSLEYIDSFPRFFFFLDISYDLSATEKTNTHRVFSDTSIYYNKMRIIGVFFVCKYKRRTYDKIILNHLSLMSIVTGLYRLSGFVAPQSVQRRSFNYVSM